MKQPTTAAAGAAAPLPALSAELKAKIAEWNQIKQWLATGSAREMELRKELALQFVPKPHEGTNNVQGLGFAVKVGHTVSRKLDEAALDSVMPQLSEQLRVVGNLILYTPKFNMAVYRTMDAADRKIFDQALTIKEDGAPTLEIIFAEDAPISTAGDVVKIVAKAVSKGGVDFKKLAARTALERAKVLAKTKPAAKSAKRKK